MRSQRSLDDCLTALIQHQSVDPSFSDEDVLDQLVTLIGAGHDTSAYFLCYACFELARHPEIQEALREELSRMKMIYETVGTRNVAGSTR